MVDTTDYRTKRQKIEALRDRATTDGERAAAQAALDRLDAAQPKTEEVSGDGYARASWDTLWRHMRGPSYTGYQSGHNGPTDYAPPRGSQAQGAGARTSGWYGPDYFDFYDDVRAELRRRQTEERLRRAGVKLPGDPGFESEFTAKAAGAQAAFKRAEATASRTHDTLSDLGRLFETGNITFNDLRRRLQEDRDGS